MTADSHSKAVVRAETHVERRRGDRRTGERRALARRAEDRARVLRSVAALAVAVSGSLAVLYALLAAIGAFDPGEAIAATLVAVGLALVWVAGFWHRLRTQAIRAQRPDRERRGF